MLFPVRVIRNPGVLNITCSALLAAVAFMPTSSSAAAITVFLLTGEDMFSLTV